MNEQEHICSVCGGKYSIDELQEFDDQLICSDCLENHTCTCSCCGERIWNEDDAGGGYIHLCPHCRDHRYTTCESCGCLIHYDDAYYDEEEDDEPVNRRKRTSQPPLFDPDADLEDSSYGRKKASIQENFSEKPVNENSPYQKAVQERTMKFKKIEQEDIERAMAATAAVRAANAAKEQQAAAPSYEGPIEATVYQPATPPEPVSQQAKPYVPTHSADVPIVRSSEPEIQVSQAPNIDDIINPSQLRAAKAGQRYNPDISGTDSINDLIAALEKEKNKL